MAAGIWHEAYDDETGMTNLSAFLEHLDHAMRRLSRSPLTLAVLSTRADELMPRRPGRRTGRERSQLLEAAQRLRAAIRPGDVAARVGDVSFAVLCEDLRSYDHAIGVAVRLLDELDRPMVVHGEVTQLDARFGIAFPLADESGGRPLFDRSIEAMRAARSSPGQRFDVILGSATRDRDARTDEASVDGDRRHDHPRVADADR